VIPERTDWSSQGKDKNPRKVNVGELIRRSRKPETGGGLDFNIGAGSGKRGIKVGSSKRKMLQRRFPGWAEETPTTGGQPARKKRWEQVIGMMTLSARKKWVTASQKSAKKKVLRNCAGECFSREDKSGSPDLRFASHFERKTGSQ